MNDVIKPIKYIPTRGRKPEDRVTVKVEMMEFEKPTEDFGFVSMWEFENGKD